MTKFLLLLGMLGAVAFPLRKNPQAKNGAYERTIAQQRAIEVSISAGGGRRFGPVKDSFRVGEPITIIVFMTNTGIATTSATIADPYYQNRPKLTKDGQELSYRQEVTDVLKWKDQQGCGAGRIFPVTLPPNEKTEADFLILCEGSHATANIVWYDDLGIGDYQFSIRRRFDCGSAFEAESNTIRFKVVP